ncbi:MAG TPA: hypothetical protein VFQ85_11250 [Mycobacteriales bacterium]|jgi:hypothetical protein|nr:hypothetical protein [Mycobacteriales bacterium]
MTNITRTRLVTLLLLLSVGVVGAIVYGIATRDGRQAGPVADGGDGTGTVVGETPAPTATAAPTASPTATSTPGPAASATSGNGPTGGDGSTGSGTPGTGSTGSGTGTVGPDDGPKTGVFFISGGVTGLTPGTTRTMSLSVRNPNPWPIQVLSLDTAVGAADRSPCPASSLEVGRYAFAAGLPHVLAPANATITVQLPAELADSLTTDQSGCAGATFPLTFSGRAVRAGE